MISSKELSTSDAFLKLHPRLRSMGRSKSPISFSFLNASWLKSSPRMKLHLDGSWIAVVETAEANPLFQLWCALWELYSGRHSLSGRSALIMGFKILSSIAMWSILRPCASYKNWSIWCTSSIPINKVILKIQASSNSIIKLQWSWVGDKTI